MKFPWRRAAALATVGWCAGAGVAHADAAGPTDYRSTIVSIEPASSSIELSIEGGDAFIAIDVTTGTEVVVLGYDDEPYVRIAADGTISENVRSVATYYNRDRYGTADIPESADNSAAPEWRTVGSGGSWAWHDHRAHWMGTEPLIGLEPGDSLPPEQIPILVDGRPVTITVVTTLVAPPSAAVPIVGLVIGLLVGLLGALLGPATSTLFACLLAGGALLVGANQYWAMPASTGPQITWWLLPALALVAAGVAIATYGRSHLLHLGLTALAGLQTALWAWQRRTALTRPVLPTTIPADLDRLLTAAALAGGTVIVVVAVRAALLAPAPTVADG